MTLKEKEKKIHELALSFSEDFFVEEYLKNKYKIDFFRGHEIPDGFRLFSYQIEKRDGSTVSIWDGEYFFFPTKERALAFCEYVNIPFNEGE